MSQKKILVVDDDPDMRLGLQLRLTANHYDVIFAADGVGFGGDAVGARIARAACCRTRGAGSDGVESDALWIPL